MTSINELFSFFSFWQAPENKENKENRNINYIINGYNTTVAKALQEGQIVSIVQNEERQRREHHLEEEDPREADDQTQTARSSR